NGVDQYGLVPRSASTVDLGAAVLDGQSCVERRDPPDGGGVGRRVAVPEDHLVDRVAGQSRALHERADDGRGELGGRDGLQYPAEPADRGTQRLTDDRFTHECSSPRRLTHLAGYAVLPDGAGRGSARRRPREDPGRRTAVIV